MRAAVLVYRGRTAAQAASLVWAAPLEGKILWEIPVAWPPNVGIIPHRARALISYLDRRSDGTAEESLAIYDLTDGALCGRIGMDARAHFNLGPRWSTFLPSPDPDLVYVYKAVTRGHHLADDYICGLRLDLNALTRWHFKIPECIAGWTLAGPKAHAQMLFIADGVEAGNLPVHDLEQKVGFWLGPDAGMGPLVSLGPRPRLHSELGHARALLFAPQHPLSVVVCNDGAIHLIDPIDFRYVERLQVPFADGHAMPIFAAQLEPAGRYLYVGTGSDEVRCVGMFERLVVYDLVQGQCAAEWELAEPYSHFALSSDGQYLLCSAPGSSTLQVIDSQSGTTKSALQLDGLPRFVMAADEAIQ
jgi:hypothetical protein